jgi:hypothetical protein
VILEILADGIRAALEQRSTELARQLAAFGGWLREVSTPPPGAELRVADGALYTGLVLVERNVVVAILASRQDHALGPPRQPVHGAPSPWSPERPPEPRWRQDEPLWQAGDTPYR